MGNIGVNEAYLVELMDDLDLCIKTLENIYLAKSPEEMLDLAINTLEKIRGADDEQ